MWLQSSAPATLGVAVHMDTMTCMTGVSRFVQTRRAWTYDKVRH